MWFPKAPYLSRLVADEGADGIDGIALTLMDEARETGEPALISVGSRGLGRVQRAWVGSVSTKIVRAADGPVLIHPQAPERRLAPSAREEKLQGDEGNGKSPFWSKLFHEHHRYGRQEKILDYVVHRVGDGANLREVMQEEYVRRLASPAEVEDILQNPRLVETARKKMQENLREAQGNIRPG